MLKKVVLGDNSRDVISSPLPSCFNFILCHIYLCSDIDVTGTTEFSVRDSTYHVLGDSVIITSDGDKYLCFSYRVYKARKQLAAIDWNYHLNQPAASTKAGGMIVTRRYNQRTKEWNSKVVKL